MNRTLYIYDHCPFCVKAEMIFGLKDVPVTFEILLNDDEKGPKRMVGKKLVPILEEDGRFMGESMDIVAHIDAIGSPVLTGPENPQIAAWLERCGKISNRLFLPRAAAAPLPEFATTRARAYFIRNKEKWAGAFFDLFEQGPDLIREVDALLVELAPMIQSPEAVNGTLSTDDLHLFAQLRSLTIVAGLTFPGPVDAYVRRMAERAKIDLLDRVAA
jgi:glutaredoxin 2